MQSPHRKATMGTVIRLPRPQRRAQLLRSAVAQFSAAGYHGTSMEVIARAAGVTKPVLYQHFPSKEILYVEVVRALGNAVVEEIEEISRRIGSTEMRITYALHQFAEVMISHDSALRLFDRAERVSTPVAAEIENILERCVEASARVLRQSRRMEEADALVLGHAMVAIAMESADLIARASDDDERRRTISVLATLFTRGLTAFPALDAPEIRGTVTEGAQSSETLPFPAATRTGN